MLISRNVYNFDSLSFYADFVGKLGRATKRAESKADIGFDWDFGMSWAKTQEILKAGGCWEEGAKDLASVELPESAKQQTELAFSLECGPVGFAPIVPNVLAGCPETMLNATQTEQPQKIIRLNVDMSICADVDSAHLFNRGKAILTCIDALQAQGYEVELWAMNTIEWRNQRLNVNVCVKQAGEYYELGKTAFCLCSVALFRRLFLRLIEAHTFFADCASDSYGSPRHTQLEGINIQPIGYKDYRYATPEKALDKVKRILINGLKD